MGRLKTFLAILCQPGGHEKVESCRRERLYRTKDGTEGKNVGTGVSIHYRSACHLVAWSAIKKTIHVISQQCRAPRPSRLCFVNDPKAREEGADMWMIGLDYHSSVQQIAFVISTPEMR